MEGNIKLILFDENDPNAKLILYENIDTSEGQSGSPVYLKKGDSWVLIGVHVGSMVYKGILYNVATGITNEKLKWIKSFIKNHMQT